MARFGVSIEKERELKKRMIQMGILEKDLEESFISSSGPGGQNVNKVASCVLLKHIPTDIQVKCQQERSQGMNRYHARWLLIQKIAQLRYEENLRAIREKEIKRRRNRKRTKAQKEAILQTKKRQSQKKGLRQKVPLHKFSTDD